MHCKQEVQKSVHPTCAQVNHTSISVSDYIKGRRSEINVDCSAGFDRRHAHHRSVVICARLWGRRGEKSVTPHAAEHIANCQRQ